MTSIPTPHATPDHIGLSHNWPLVLTLWLLCAIPGIPAALILALLVLQPADSALFAQLVDPQYLASPWAVLVHGGSGVAFFLTMPWQFSPKLRQRFPRWHRLSGRVVLASAYLLAVSGVWLHLFLTPDELGMRFIGLLVITVAMLISFSMALYAVFKRQYQRHQRWMYRAVAVTLAVVTLNFIEAAALLTVGQLTLFKPLLATFFHDYGRLLGLALNLWLVSRLLRTQSLPVATGRARAVRERLAAGGFCRPDGGGDQ